ncbi:transmembrane channel-like protein [Episyrphus balteatus]|uniref:transmembrane channel-like protein n=1 Tax=Episyrphus balteatus TaxID=286459 RepID=UPI00248620FD|nr:transmembrane channel-like protein [Episyrphus balteatus]
MLGHFEPIPENGKRSQEDKSNELSANLTSNVPLDAFGAEQHHHHHQPSDNEDDEEEYSVSVSAIMQRRASVRGNRKCGSRKSRRASSPMDHVLDTVSQTGGTGGGDRRRSSVFTTSSGDTAISVDDGTNQDSTQEQIYENIRLHKEVIQSVKLQPWNIRKKLKLVRQAKTYVARHEGALQERFALSRSLRDLWARFKILMAARWRHWKRETSSFLTVLIPWELRIKEIESHFGSGVASYFTFLRWLLWVNIMMTIPLVAFVIAPEVLSTNPDEEDPRKKMSERELKVAGNLFTIWEFEGYLKYSPLFYGYYSSSSGATRKGYNLPLAYFLTAVAVYVYSFVATLRKMAENSRNSKLSSKDDECIFSWKLFTGWDFMIGHAETAHNRIASVVVGFKEALLEEAEKKKDNRNWRIILQRILVNILVIGLLAASGYTVVSAVDRSETVGTNASWYRRNEVNVIMTLLSFFLPMIFDALGLFENWHPRQQLRLQLARIMILNLLNLYSLMFSFIYKITGKDESLQQLKEINQNATLEMTQIEKMIADLTLLTSSFTTSKPNSSDFNSSPAPLGFSPTTTSTTLGNLFNRTMCFIVPVNCSIPLPSPTRTLTTSMLLLNLSTSTTLVSETSWTTTTSPSKTTLPLTTTTPYDAVTTSVDFLTSTTNLNDLIANPSNTSVDPFTSSSSTSMFFESTSPPPLLSSTSSSLSTTSEDYRSQFNDTYFDYHDYFDNFLSMDIEDRDQEGNEKGKDDDDGQRVRRSIESFSPSSTSTDGTEYTDSTDTTESSTLNFASTNTYTLDVSSLSTLTELMGTMPTISSTSTVIDPVRDKVLEYISTLKPDEPSSTSTSSTSDEKEPDTTTYPTTRTTTPSSTIAVTISDKQMQTKTCTQTVCVTIPPEYCTTPMTPKVDDLSTTDATTLSTTTTIAPLIQLQYHEERRKNITLIVENMRRNLTSMCWETSLGQELSKIIVFDMIMSIVAPLCIDFLRALFVRYINKYWCWDMEKTFPQYGDFKIAESILNLVYNQGQVWMGIFFSPGLVIINFVKLMILMYLRSWIVLTCNVPHEVVFKASKSNNFYLSLLLTMLFLCVLPVGYAIVWLRPSWHCGPFSDYDRISEFFTKTIIKGLPPELHKPLEYLTSPSTVIPLLLLLTLIIYYLVSLTGALREANQDLRNQLLKEREEERKKMFKLPDTKTNEQAATALTNRWRKVLEASSPVTPTGPGQQAPDFDEEIKNQARKELIARIMKKALRKGSATSDDDSYVRGKDEDDTDTEYHESLPHDEESKEKLFGLSKLQQIRRTRKPSLVDIVQIAKSEQAKTKDPQHPKSRFKVDKVNKPDKPVKLEKVVKAEKRNDCDNDNDPDTNSRVVSERRMSLLQKQSPESEEMPSKPSLAKIVSSNFAVINEKSSEVPKNPKKKNSQNSRPEPFKFDDKSIERKKNKEKRHAENEKEPGSPEKEKEREKKKTDGSSPEKERKKPKGSPDKDKSKSKNSPEKEKKKFPKSPENEKKKHSRSPSPLDKEKKKTNTSPQDREKDKEKEKEKKKTPDSPEKEKKKPTSDSPEKKKLTSSPQEDGKSEAFFSFSKQGRKKIGNLMNFVREAVKKADLNSPSDSPPSTPSTTIEIEPSFIASSKPEPNTITQPEPEQPTTSTTSPPAVKKPLQAPIVDSEEEDQPGPTPPPVRSGSLRWKNERPTPARQDSQASVWSDNIPTITISTTGSEECIVDCVADSQETNPNEGLNGDAITNGDLDLD